jgi:hypothetical protein
MYMASARRVRCVACAQCVISFTVAVGWLLLDQLRTHDSYVGTMYLMLMKASSPPCFSSS